MTIGRRELIGAGASLLAAGPAIAAARPQKAKFLWGAATAAHQIEGGNVNSDYRVLEHLPKPSLAAHRRLIDDMRRGHRWA